MDVQPQMGGWQIIYFGPLLCKKVDNVAFVLGFWGLDSMFVLGFFVGFGFFFAFLAFVFYWFFCVHFRCT
jgi:hypothetical protein